MERAVTYRITWWEIPRHEWGLTNPVEDLYAATSEAEAKAKWITAYPHVVADPYAFEYTIERVTPYSKAELKTRISWDTEWYKNPLIIRSIVELL